MKRALISSLILTFLFLTSQTYAQGIITTLAGNGVQNYSGDGSLATNAQLNFSLKVRGDLAGNIYIADNNNHRIRKIDAATGIIHTIAGNGISGFWGDGYLAINAQIDGGYICLDNAGNIYLTDNNRIRKIDAATGIIHTIAGTGAAGYTGDGGTADTATFNTVAGIFVDAANNIYVSDCHNNVIRKIDGTTNVVTTVCGNGYMSGTFYGGFSGDGGTATNASLDHPLGICADAIGNIYFIDGDNKRVREVSSGIINTIAGNGTGGVSSGDGVPATGAHLEFPVDICLGAGGKIYIAEDVCRIRLFYVGGEINTVAGNAGQGYNGDNISANTSKLYFPESVYCDAGGNVFIGDDANERIRKVDSLGVIHTIAGTGFISFAGDSGLCTHAELNNPIKLCADASGNIYISDGGNYRIRKIDASGIITTVTGNGDPVYSGDGGLATSATIAGVGSMCVDAIGNLYFVAGGGRVRKIDAASGIITTVAGNGTYSFSGDGGPATAAGLRGPETVSIDAAGNLYIGENARLREVFAGTGIITTISGDGISGRTGDGGIAIEARVSGNIDGLFVSASGDIYLTDAYYNIIRKIAAGTEVISTIAGTGVVTSIYDGAGGYNYIGGYTGNGGPAINAQLNHPTGVFVDGSGTIYIADRYNNVIRAITADGVINTIAGNGFGASLNPSDFELGGGFSGDGGPATTAELRGPYDVCLDHTGNILIADASNNRIRKVSNPLSVYNVTQSAGVSITPNPSSGAFVVKSQNSKISGIDVFDVIGEKVYHADGMSTATTIDLTDKPAGIYIVAVKENGQTIVQKLVVAH